LLFDVVAGQTDIGRSYRLSTLLQGSAEAMGLHPAVAGYLSS
jgi:hypothetical protein